MSRHGKARAKKPPGAAVDPRNGQRVRLDHVELMRFDPPAGLCPVAADAWESYWTDPVAQLVTSADRVMLTRWITMVDRFFRLTDIADRNPVTVGSTGQTRTHPAYTLAMQQAGEIAKLEAQLGVGPANRARLGLAVLSERRTLQELNTEDDDTGADDGPDPRLTLLRGDADA